MKKALKITGIVIGALLLIIILIPIALKGKIKDIVIAQGNKMLNAEFTMDDLSLSLIRNFPNATVTIKGFELWGKDDFAADTLLSADRVSATVNLKSLFGDRGYEIKRVEVAGTDVKAIVLEDGRPNWDIMKPSDEPGQEEKDDDEPSDFRILLKKLTLSDINVIYDDRQGKMYASVEGLGLALSGDMTADHTTLKLETDIESLGFRYGGIPLVSKARIAIKTDIDADLANMKFTIEDNSIAINAIRASLEGMVAMLEPDGFDMDIKLNTDKIGFKDLLSMIPAIYAKDFAGLEASGSVTLSAWAKGRMQGDNLPAFDASVNVSGGQFRYPSLPKSVDNINIAATAKHPGGNADLVVVNVNPLKLSVAGNDFAATLRLATPVSDPDFAVTANGVVDLGMIKDVYPLEDMELNGKLDADLELKGRLSYVEKEQYDKFTASGGLTVTDMLVKMKDMPDLSILKSVFRFTPQYLNLSETTVNIGKSDITADCRLENYMGFVFKQEMIKGSLNVRSNMLDLNEMMGNDEAAPEAPAEESTVAAPEIPKNISFDMNVSLAKVLFDNIVLDNTQGKVVISGGKLDMRNLSTNTLGGAVVANGYYSTAENAARPELNAAFGLNGVSFKQTFNTFVTIQKMAPIFEGLNGNFSGNVNINTRMDSLTNPVYETMNGSGAISTKDLNLSNVAVIDRIADAIKKPEMKNINVRDMNLAFTIKEGRVHTTPFDVKMGDYLMNLSGSTGIDQTIAYTGKVTLPESTGIGKYTTLDLKIGGTFSSPSVTLDTESMVQQAAQQATQDALESLGNKLGVDISDAQAQRQTLIDQAQKAGDKLVEEAQKTADKLLAEAGDNALKKVAAQAAGKKLVDEAQKQSANLVAKATAEGDKLVEKAQAGEPVAE